jgi:hypothetical protein
MAPPKKKSRKHQQSGFDMLPEDALCVIAGFMDLNDMAACDCVSSRFAHCFTNTMGYWAPVLAIKQSDYSLLTTRRLLLWSRSVKSPDTVIRLQPWMRVWDYVRLLTMDLLPLTTEVQMSIHVDYFFNPVLARRWRFADDESYVQPGVRKFALALAPTETQQQIEHVSGADVVGRDAIGALALILEPLRDLELLELQFCYPYNQPDVVGTEFVRGDGGAPPTVRLEIRMREEELVNLSHHKHLRVLSIHGDMPGVFREMPSRLNFVRMLPTCYSTILPLLMYWQSIAADPAIQRDDDCWLDLRESAGPPRDEANVNKIHLALGMMLSSYTVIKHVGLPLSVVRGLARLNLNAFTSVHTLSLCTARAARALHAVPFPLVGVLEWGRDVDDLLDYVSEIQAPELSTLVLGDERMLSAFWPPWMPNECEPVIRSRQNLLQFMRQQSVRHVHLWGAPRGRNTRCVSVEILGVQAILHLHTHQVELYDLYCQADVSWSSKTIMHTPAWSRGADVPRNPTRCCTTHVTMNESQLSVFVADPGVATSVPVSNINVM